jgi:hypothetical protein
MKKLCPRFYDLREALHKMPSMNAAKTIDSAAFDEDDSDQDPAVTLQSLMGTGAAIIDDQGDEEEARSTQLDATIDRDVNAWIPEDYNDDDNASMGSFDPDGPHDDGPHNAALRPSATPTPASRNSGSGGNGSGGNRKRRSSKSKAIADVGTQFLAESASASQALVKVKQEEMAQNRKIEESKLQMEEERLRLAREVEERAKEVEQRKLAVAEKDSKIKAMLAMQQQFPELTWEQVKARVEDV